MHTFGFLWSRRVKQRVNRTRNRGISQSALAVESLGVDLLERRQVMTAAPHTDVAALQETLAPTAVIVSSAVLATTPTAPINLRGDTGNGQVQLSWSAPLSNGGSPVTDYSVQYSVNAGLSWAAFQDGQSTNTTTTVTGLTNDSAYLFRVSAVNAAGIGAGATVRVTPSAANAFLYAQNATGITITKYTGAATAVSVPQFINGMRVTEIGNGAFQGRGDVTRITLPQGITRIGNNAFDGCGQLTSVNIPNGVTSIGDTAFIWCGKLQTLNIPASVTSIGIFWSFWGCNSLTSINVDPANTKYASQDGILYNKDKTWLYWCPGGKAGDVKLAPTVKTIGYFSFENCNRITSITIPASVTLIEDGVFDKCTSLRSFYFLGNAPTVRSSFDPSVRATAYYMSGTTGWGATLGGVPTQVFVGQTADYTYKITNAGITITKYTGTATVVAVPQFINGMRVTEIGNGAFQGRGDITRVTLPQGLTRIGNNAFDGCGNLVSVNIPNGVTSIGDTAFIWCGKLQTLNIPASVTSIGIFWSFWGCGSMTSINVDPTNTKYASLDGILYNKDMTWLYWCPGGKSGDVTLAPTVKTIGYFSFEGCTKITTVTIPASVNNIESCAFDGCSSCRAFYFLGNAPSASNLGGGITATAYYMSGTTGWGATLGGVPTQLFVGQTGDYTYKITNTGITITKYTGTATVVTVPQFINGMRVTEIGNGAFESRWDITRVTLPQGITRIGTDAFKACDRLTSVSIPNGVTEIGSGAFIWCGKLQTLNIPASVTSIPIFWTFWGCNSLTSINVDPANTKYASQDGILYNKDKTWLYWCPGGKAGDVKLAPTVKTIGYFSFENCNRITSITIPASVTLIEDGVFDKCTSLRSFYFLGNAPTVRSSFDPSVKATAYYIRGTTGWGSTLGGLPTATTPTAPTNLIGTANNIIVRPFVDTVGAGRVELSWSAPASDGNAAIKDYVVQWSSDGGRTWTTYTHAASAATRLTIQQLQSGRTYVFRVAALNDAGQGSFSLLSNAVYVRPRPPIILVPAAG